MGGAFPGTLFASVPGAREADRPPGSSFEGAVVSGPWLLIVGSENPHIGLEPMIAVVINLDRIQSNLAIADIIKIGGLVLGQGGGTPTVPGQSGTWGGIPNSVIVNFTQQMDASGVPIPEGAFEVDPETGMFTSSSGQLIDFADAFSELVDIFRQEDPQEFALAIAGEDADPSLREIVGAATYNVARQLVDYIGTDEDSARQQVLATILSGTSQMINNANGAIQFGETHPDNTELAKLSRNLSNLSDASNTTAVKEGMEALREYNDAFQAKEYFDPSQ